MRLLLAAFAALALAACSDPCLDLAKKVCSCNPDIAAAKHCKSQAEAQSANISTSNAEDDRCDALLAQCTCDTLETLEGRRACGLAN